MTAKILQLANSAFFGLRRRVVTPKDAVLYLGFDTIKSLTLTVRVFSEFAHSRCPNFSVQNLAQHSVFTGALARKIAKEIRLSGRDVEDSFMAGLLHDVGKLILVDSLPERFDSALKDGLLSEGISGHQAEQSVFGTTHAEVGTYLLWLWGLPDTVVEAVAYHHAPTRCPAQQRSPLTAVYLANMLIHAQSGSGRIEVSDLDPSRTFERLGLSHSDLRTWHDLAGEALHEQEIG